MWRQTIVLHILLVFVSSAQGRPNEFSKETINMANRSLSVSQINTPLKNDKNSDESCICVPFHLCDSNNIIITNGDTLIDQRRRKRATARNDGNTTHCDDNLLTCCKMSKSAEIQEKEIQKICGRRLPMPLDMRVNFPRNETTYMSETPWMVAILEEMRFASIVNTLNVYKCGGSLISERAVLTAAHCVAEGTQVQSLKIRAGVWNVVTNIAPFLYQDRKVRKIIIHEEYEPKVANDLAILILEDPVEIKDHINVVCRPEEVDSFDSSQCFATGWGKNIYGAAGRYQNSLKKIFLPIIPRDICQQQLSFVDNQLGQTFELDKSFLCAGGQEQVDMCTGDDGSPLVCPLKDEPDRFVQVGVVSWGVQCGLNNVPRVYTDVTQAFNWIEENLS